MFCAPILLTNNSLDSTIVSERGIVIGNSEILFRPALVNRLEEVVNRYPLTVICGPAGSGKSALLAMFAMQADRPVVVVPESPQGEILKSVVTALASRFTTINRLALLRFLKTPDFTETLQDLLQALPPHLIVIDSQATGSLHPFIPYSRFLVATRVLPSYPDNYGLIGEGDLAFSPEEIKSIAMKRFGIWVEDEEAVRLRNRTGGNAGRLLAAIRQEQQVMGYFESLPDDLKWFLPRAGVFPMILSERCRALLGVDPEPLIWELTQRGILSEGRIARGDLRQVARRLDEEEFRALSLKAAGILISERDYQAAGKVLLNLGDYPRLLEFIGRYGREIYSQGKARLLGNWFGQIPDEELSRSPTAMLLCGRVLANDLDQPGLALDLFVRAERAFLEEGQPLEAVQASLWQSVALRLSGDPVTALHLARIGVRKLEELGAGTALLAWALRVRGLAYRLTGSLEHHFADISQALAFYTVLKDGWYIAMCHHDLGLGLDQAGQVETARYHYEQAVRVWEELSAWGDLSNTLNCMGNNQHLRGEFEQALDYFQQSRLAAEKSGSSRRLAFVHSSIAVTSLALERFKEALEELDRSNFHARRAEARAVMVYNTVTQGSVHLGRGDIEQAEKAAELAIYLATERCFTQELGLACELRGEISLARLDTAGALDYFSRAVEVFLGCDRPGAIRSQLMAAQAYLADMRQSAALDALRQAITMAKECTLDFGTITKKALPVLAHFWQCPAATEADREGIELLGGWQLLPRTQFISFGEPKFMAGGRAWGFSNRGIIGRTPELLLHLLLAEPAGIGRETVQTNLWPDEAPERSRNYFHQVVRRLREVNLEDPRLLRPQEGCYSFKVNFCDYLAFTYLARRIEASPELELRLELIDLYRGELLAGFDLGEWGRDLRQQAELIFLKNTKLAVRELLALKENEKALGYLRHGLKIEPYDEDLITLNLEVHQTMQLGYPVQKIAQQYALELGFVPECLTGY